jgi:hypothetical protein
MRKCAFGFLAPDAVNILKRVQKVMHNNVMSPRFMNIIFQRLSFAIPKGLAAQLVTHLSFLHAQLYIECTNFKTKFTYLYA